MNLKEFKAWLEQFPEDTIVQVVVGVDHNDFYGPQPQTVDFTADVNWGDWDFIDFTKNSFVKPDAPHYGKKYLELGAE